jgi:predicted Na+-dependent transporter
MRDVMNGVGGSLVWLGARGPALLVASLIAGFLVPPLGDAGVVALPTSAFLLTLGSFITAGLAPPERANQLVTRALVLLWLGVVVPLLGAVALSSTNLEPGLKAGVFLSLCAPPVGSAAAIAAMLGLQPRLALLASVTLTLLAPLSMPGLAYLLTHDVPIDTRHFAPRLAAIIGGAAVVAFFVLRRPERFSSILPNPRAGAGIAVVGLVVVGLAAAHAAHGHWHADSIRFGRIVLAAIAVNVLACSLGALVFARLGLAASATVGLVSGNRNVTLAWAAGGFTLPAPAQEYLAACVIPVLMLPLVVKGALALAAQWPRQPACDQAIQPTRPPPN